MRESSLAPCTSAELTRWSHPPVRESRTCRFARFLTVRWGSQCYRTLEVVSGKLYQQEKLYLRAFESYSKACRGEDGRYHPTSEILSLAETAFLSALEEKKNDQAQTMLEGFEKDWQINTIVISLLRARLAIATSDPETARQELENAKKQSGRFNGETRKKIDNDITQIETLLGKK